MSQEAATNTTIQADPIVPQSKAEEVELQAVMERLDETGERIAQSLGRIHGLMQDIVGEWRAGRPGARPNECQGYHHHRKQRPQHLPHD